MNNNFNALAALVAPAIALSSATPIHFVSTKANEEFATTTETRPDAIHLSPLNLKQGNPADESISIKTSGESGQCSRNHEFTFYSEQPILGTEDEGLIIEECDSTNPNQTRIAYVSNKNTRSKSSPTSILIGCASKSVNPYTMRKGGGFANVASGQQYSNFNLVRRGSTAIGGSTLITRHKPIHATGIKKRSSMEDAEKELNLARRWETRSDIDQYSDGFHSCRSSYSSACSFQSSKQVCNDLQKALNGTLLQTAATDEAQMAKRFQCIPKGYPGKGIQCPDVPLGGPIFIREMDEGHSGNLLERTATTPAAEEGPVMVKRAPVQEPLVEGAVAVSPEKRQVDVHISPRESKKVDQAEFMRRWLQGDEHPRSFLLKRDGEKDDAAVERRDVRSSEANVLPIDTMDQEAVMAPRSLYSHHSRSNSCSDIGRWNDPRCVNRRRGCSDWSDQYKPQCKGVDFSNNFYKREENEAVLKKRSPLVISNVYRVPFDRYHDDAESCDDGSDRFNPLCQKIFQQGRPYKRQENADLTKRSPDFSLGEKEGALKARSVYSDYTCNSLSDRYKPYCRDLDRTWNKRGEVEKTESANVLDPRGAQEEVGSVLERRSRHGGHRRGGRRSSRSRSRRGLNDDDEAEIVEKRSYCSSRGGRRCWSRRDAQNDEEAVVLHKRTDDDENKLRYPLNLLPSNQRQQHLKRVEAEKDPHQLDARDWNEDALTVRSPLSEHGSIFERGQQDYAQLVKKREVVETLKKRDLATAVWKMTVAPLLRRREAMSATPIFKRDTT